MATLSCTDCSGSSTASSDITEPGSPFSTASSHSEDSQQQVQVVQVRTTSDMAPNTGTHHPPWPWQDAGGGGGGATQPKRAKTQQQHLKNCVVQPPIASTVPPVVNHDLKSNVLLLSSTGRERRTNQPVMHIKVQQGKITEYFKSQMKANSVKKEINLKLNNDSIKKAVEQKINNTAINGKRKYLTLIDRPKVMFTIYQLKFMILTLNL